MNAALRRAAHLQFTLRNLIEALDEARMCLDMRHAWPTLFSTLGRHCCLRSDPGESAALRSIAGSDK